MKMSMEMRSGMAVSVDVARKENKAEKKEGQ